MKQVSVHEAKTHLSKLLLLVAIGEEVIISKSGHPIAKIVPFEKIKAKRVPGVDKGKGYISEDFDEELPEKILEEFYGRGKKK